MFNRPEVKSVVTGKKIEKKKKKKKNFDENSTRSNRRTESEDKVYIQLRFVKLQITNCDYKQNERWTDRFVVPDWKSRGHGLSL